jgi:hypothetical protein
MNGIVKMLRNGLAAAGIAGQENVLAHVALFCPNMKLHADVLHKVHPFVRLNKNIIASAQGFFKFYPWEA